MSDAEAVGDLVVQIRCSTDEAYQELLDGFVMTGDLGYSLSDGEYRFSYNDNLQTITVFL